MYMPTSSMLVYFQARGARVHTHRPQAVYFRALRAHIYAYCRQVGLLSGAKHTCTCPPAAGLSTLGREVSVYMPQALAPKRLVKDIRISQLFYRHTITTHAQRQQAGLLSSARLYAHQQQAGLLSGVKHPFTCPSAAGRLLSGCKPGYCRALSIYGYQQQADLLSGAECIWPPAAGRFTFGCEAPVYMPTGRRPFYFGARSDCVHAAVASREVLTLDFECCETTSSI